MNHNTKQSGVVLLTGMVFLLMLTVLGLSSMQSSTLESKIANNYNQANSVFQASESSISRLSTNPTTGSNVPNEVEDALASSATVKLSNINDLCLDPHSGQDVRRTNNQKCDSGYRIEARGRVRYLDETATMGSSMGLYVNYHFNFTGEGSIQNPDAADPDDNLNDLSRSVVSRGGYVLAPVSE
jgi:hypothetical protein